MAGLLAKTLHGFKWTSIEQFSNKAIQLGLFVLLARLLSKEAFGLIALASILVSFLQIFATQGFNDALIQRDSLEGEDKDSAFWTNCAIGLVLTFFTVLMAPVVSSFFNEDMLTTIIRVMSLSFIFGALSTVPAAILRREMNFRPLAIRSLMGKIVGGVCAVIVALNGGGVWSIVVQQLVGQFTGLILLWTLGDYFPKFRYSWSVCKEMFAFSSSIMIFHVINFMNRRYDIFALGKFFPIEIVGMYSVAQRILELATTLFMGIFGTVGYPMMCKLRADMDRFRRVVLLMFDVLLLVSIPFSLSLVYFSDEWITVLFGVKWLPSAAVLALLAPSLVVRLITWSEQLGITALGKPSYRRNLGALFALVSVSLVSLGVYYGLAAFTLAAMARFIVIALPIGMVFAKLADIPHRRLLWAHLQPLLVAFVTIGSAAYILNTSNVDSIGLRIIGMLLSVGIYALVMLQLKRNEIKEMYQILRKKAKA